ncbi:Hexose carrier protein HEX6 [Sesamum alatum]|uniref:Hexose carrier protein HEX6 n=1 Tax=Sesamum alatum TaxID=300844 RepID=A0AAE1YKJ4_9LAMI|nr:Hexose carrier protein HEX6 [Sesamum alatum]
MSEAVHYNGKITRFVLLSCIIAATGGLIFGYGTGVTGGVASTEPFLKKFFPAIYRKMNEEGETTSNYCKFDSQLLTFFTSSFLISGLISTSFASPVTRALGRKASIFIGGVAFIVGSVLGGAAKNIYMLICSVFYLE